MNSKVRSGAAREAAKRAKARSVAANRIAPSAKSEDELFADLRTGATNVAGVAYQLALASYLLSASRSAAKGLPAVVRVRPEGFEDVDCQLADESWLLVQSKQRGPGARKIGVAEAATILAHAAKVMGTTDYKADVSGIAIVTNGAFSEDVGTSGWDSTLDQVRDASDPGDLGESLRQQLAQLGLAPDLAPEILKIAHTVSTGNSIHQLTEDTLTEAYGLHPTVSSIARSYIVTDLTQLSGSQRGSSVIDAAVRGVSDLDSMIELVVRDVDISALDEAVRLGVCEFANFAIGSPDSEVQFFAGVRVLPGHIASGLDVVRYPETDRILESLESNRQVLIVGPSGTGKSGLLWRSASMAEDRAMVVRVLKVENESNAELLVQYIRQLRPQADRRVLVCIDDLGRDLSEHWPQARDRLLEIPGVRILGACRQEDLLPSISAGAVVLDSRLNSESANRIYERLRASGVPLVTEPEEVLSRANGLLMEYVAIATTGHRLRDVLRSQIERIRASENSLTLDALATIVALHTLGHSVDADSLPTVLGATPREVSVALTTLHDEHLVTTQFGTEWRALHDLRAEVLLDLLHVTPPPTLASTYARSIACAAPDARPTLYRRASVRLGRALVGQISTDLPLALSRVHDIFRPIREALVEDLRRLVLGDTSSRSYSLLRAHIEAAERLDVVAYAVATLRYVEKSTPISSGVGDYYLMAYASKFSDVFTSTDLFQRVVEVGRGLPAWNSSIADTVVKALPRSTAEAALREMDLASAIGLSEALEGNLSIGADQVASIFATHSALLIQSPSMRDVDLLSQLVATLSRLADLDPAGIEASFGPARMRAEWAAAADQYAISVELQLEALSLLPSSGSSLTREDFYSDSHFAEVSFRGFARPEDEHVERGYQPQPGSDPTSMNSQAVFAVQRMFDACPEADVVSVALLFANLESTQNGLPAPGEKRIRAGVIPRAVATRRSIAIQACVMELVSSEQWTARCRAQAQLSAELVTLLSEAPARLSDQDNARRRAAWIVQANATASRVARMPGIPIDRALLEVSGADLAIASNIDQLLRENAKDKPRKALDLIASSLVQVAKDPNDKSAVRGAGMRLAGAATALREAREAALLPTFAGVGETLPASLDSLSVGMARLFSGFEGEEFDRRALRAATAEQVKAITSGIAHSKAKSSLNALTARLLQVGIQIDDFRIVEVDAPPDPSNYLGIVGSIDVSDWGQAEDALRSWTAKEREAAGFVARLELIVRARSRLVPIGVSMLGSSGSVLPLMPDKFTELSARLDLPMSDSNFQKLAENAVAVLFSASYRKIRNAHRPKSWSEEPDQTDPSVEVALSTAGPEPWSNAIEALRELARHVDQEGDTGDTLAGAAADLDVTNPSSESYPLALLTTIRLCAIDADLWG
jgi:hypothetical protein